MRYTGKLNELLLLSGPDNLNHDILSNTDNDTMIIIWNMDGGVQVNLDGQEIALIPNQILFLTGVHHVDISEGSNQRIIRFNRPFYCVINHDEEVGCKGILFYGAEHLTSIIIPEEDLEKYETLWRMFVLEMKVHDTIQVEMLQMMLKRFVILCIQD